MKREDNMQWNVLLKHSPQFTDKPLIQLLWFWTVDHSLVRFKHQNYPVRFRKRSGFGLKIVHTWFTEAETRGTFLDCEMRRDVDGED